MVTLGPIETMRDPGECVIRVGHAEAEIADLYPFLTEVSVATSRDSAAEATLKFESVRDEAGAWSVQDDGRLVPWEPIRIEAAFGNDFYPVLQGYIREVKVSHPPDGPIATVEVKCQDASLAMDRTQVRFPWGAEAPTNDGVIVSDILGRHGWSLTDDSKTGLQGIVVNQDATDIAFLKARAEANGYELIFYPDEVYFGPMRIDMAVQPTILVYAGPDSNCASIDISVDAHQPDEVVLDLADEEGSESTEIRITSDLTVMGTTPATSKSSGLDDFAWRMKAGGGSEDEVRARAQRKANDLSMKVKATGELDGSLYGHVLRVGEPVPVDGVGEWLGGHYYVDAVTHVFDPDGYRQSFTLLRNGFGDDLESGSSMLSGVP